MFHADTKPKKHSPKQAKDETHNACMSRAFHKKL